MSSITSDCYSINMYMRESIYEIERHIQVFISNLVYIRKFLLIIRLWSALTRWLTCWPFAFYLPLSTQHILRLGNISLTFSEISNFSFQPIATNSNLSIFFSLSLSLRRVHTYTIVHLRVGENVQNAVGASSTETRRGKYIREFSPLA